MDFALTACFRSAREQSECGDDALSFEQWLDIE